MSSSVSDENLEKKFQAVTNTQDSIQTLSLWLLHHKAHHQKIVTSWMKVLKKAKITHRLTLFYLANDVVQNGKRKGFQQFGNSFAEVLREATLLVRDEQIRPSIQRVFGIWEQRSVYTPEFIADLRAILANTKVPATAHSKLLAEFKPEVVIEKLRLVMKLELEASSKMSTINLSKLNATNAEIVRQLKDRTHGQQFKREFDESARCLDELIKTISREIKERTELILLLEQSEIYYDTQRGEAKIVANAYKNFGGRVKTLQKKLEEITASLPSPLPSPCPDAPSPTTSDHELELKLPNDKAQTNEVENLENVPSPVGTPEGLNLSPQKPVEKEPQPVSTQSIGNPIPTLSNFFSNGQGGMSSWLDTFTNKKLLDAATEKKVEISKPDASSLDSRLSNLLQNIPNLPSGLQTTIFGNSSSGNNTPLHDSVNSPLRGKKDATLATESTTPIKDEYSGQNTPLQDEESSLSSHAFFQKMTSNNKSKDILTSLIQSVSSDKTIDDGQKKDKYGYGSAEQFDQGGGMSSFIKKIIPQTPHSSSPSYFNPTQPALSTPVQTASVTQTSTVGSYETTSFHDVPVYSSKPTSERTEQMSFIPTLVPSMSQDNFDYNSYPTNEYNPELETFDTDMEIGDPTVDEQSPPTNDDSLSPVPSASLDEMPRSIGGRRCSTLITVVTKDSPDNSLPTSHFPPDDMYKNDKENVTQDSGWVDNISSKPENTWPKSLPSQESLGDSSPNEEFFIGKDTSPVPPFYTSVPPPPPPPPPIDHGPPNGQNIHYGNPNNQPINAPMDLPLSKIETVQTHRDDLNGRWPGNNWIENERRPIEQFSPGLPPMPCGMQQTRFFDQNNYHPPPFAPRNHWIPRHRLDKPFHRPYGPYQNKRFSFRGRGRGRHYPQY